MAKSVSGKLCGAAKSHMFVIVVDQFCEFRFRQFIFILWQHCQKQVPKVQIGLNLGYSRSDLTNRTRCFQHLPFNHLGLFYSDDSFWFLVELNYLQCEFAQ